MCSSGGKASERAAAQARKDEEDRQHKLSAGMQSIDDAFGTKAGFTDAFYNQRQADYSNYYLPQIRDQYRNAREQLLFGLTRSGLTRSTAGAHQNALLDRARGLRKDEVFSGAKDYANQTRKAVEGAKQNVIAQLYATTNPEAAARSAITSADLQLHPVNTFSPIGDLFSKYTDLGATSVAATDYGYPGLFPSIFNRGYTGTTSSQSGMGSGKVIGK